MEQSNKSPEFLEYVLDLNQGMPLQEALAMSLRKIDEIDINQLKRIGLSTYEPGKWTINKILQHLIDWERVWCYRSIIFGRREGSIPDGHDQQIMAENSNADERTIEELIAELKIVRQSTIMMFGSFNQEILETRCDFFEYTMTIEEIGLTIATHQIHHLNVIKERYLSLDPGV